MSVPKPCLPAPSSSVALLVILCGIDTVPGPSPTCHDTSRAQKRAIRLLAADLCHGTTALALHSPHQCSAVLPHITSTMQSIHYGGPSRWGLRGHPHRAAMPQGREGGRERTGTLTLRDNIAIPQVPLVQAASPTSPRGAHLEVARFRAFQAGVLPVWHFAALNHLKLNCLELSRPRAPHVPLSGLVDRLYEAASEAEPEHIRESRRHRRGKPCDAE